MRTSRTASLVFGIALSIASATACTLFVSLDGLSGDAADPTADVSVVSGGLYRAPKGGGGSAELVAPFAQPTGLLVDSDALYVADAATRLISRIAK